MIALELGNCALYAEISRVEDCARMGKCFFGGERLLLQS